MGVDYSAFLPCNVQQKWLADLHDQLRDMIHGVVAAVNTVMERDSLRVKKKTGFCFNAEKKRNHATTQQLTRGRTQKVAHAHST